MKNKKPQNIYEEILFSLPEIIFIFDSNGVFLDFNYKKENILYLKPSEFIGKAIQDVSLPQEIKTNTYKLIQKVFLDKKERTHQYFLGDKYYEARFLYLQENKVLSIIRDITHFKEEELNQKILLETKLRAKIVEDNYLMLKNEIAHRNEVEKELQKTIADKNQLIKEVHHRVKNNLQIISSIINLEIKTKDSKSIESVLKKLQNRINSISAIHDVIYQNELFSEINLGNYFNRIIVGLIRSFGNKVKPIEFETDDIIINLEMGVPFGMILNELIHDYLSNIDTVSNENSLNIKLFKENDKIALNLFYPLNYKKNNKNKICVVKSKLSSQLIEALISQINGNYRIIDNELKNINFLIHL